MTVIPKTVEERLNRSLIAWETLRPEKPFAGMNLSQFKLRLQPSLESRRRIAQLEDQLRAEISARYTADVTSMATVNLLVNAVKGDPEEGEDGQLYEAFGYVRKSERKSGLKRPRRNGSATA